jgi:prepilin-type N-terminal cleavage/methylation domain-containing protein
MRIAPKSLYERGFTLIEMSIVLIIIGLIIGGILKGQELIESARQKNFVSQTDGIKAAINSFSDRFRALPGDSSRTTNICALCAGGNDNGVVGTAATNYAGIIATDADAVSTEYKEFWNHLVGSGMIGGGSTIATATAAGNFAGGPNPSPFPGSSFPQSGLFVTYGTHEGEGVAGQDTTGHWLRAQRYGATGGVFAAAASPGDAIIAPQRAFQLDLKYDDGRASLGRIRALAGTADCGAAGGTTTYTAAETAVECGILMLTEN